MVRGSSVVPQAGHAMAAGLVVRLAGSVFAVVGCSALQISISSNDSVFQIFYVLTDFLSTCSSDY